MVSGPPGAGKSTLSGPLCREFRWVWLDKDAIDEPFSPGKRDVYYNREIEPKVLEALLNLARLNLQGGQSVLIDLPWTHILLNEPQWVQKIQNLIEETGVKLLVLECRLSEESLKKRLTQRGLARDQSKLSEEGWVAFRKRDRLGERNPFPHYEIDMEEGIESCLEKAKKVLEPVFIRV